MAFKSPPEITVAAAETGTTKAKMSPDKALVGGFLAGAYIAFAGLLAVVVSSGLDPEKVGGVLTLITGTVFTLGLILVVVAGSELLTGNMALVPLAVMQRRVPVRKLFENFTWITIGNVAGAVFIAWF